MKEELIKGEEEKKNTDSSKMRNSNRIWVGSNRKKEKL
jgi:hypothetical protein